MTAAKTCKEDILLFASFPVAFFGVYLFLGGGTEQMRAVPNAAFQVLWHVLQVVGQTLGTALTYGLLMASAFICCFVAVAYSAQRRRAIGGTASSVFLIAMFALSFGDSPLIYADDIRLRLLTEQDISAIMEGTSVKHQGDPQLAYLVRTFAEGHHGEFISKRRCESIQQEFSTHSRYAEQYVLMVNGQASTHTQVAPCFLLKKNDLVMTFRASYARYGLGSQVAPGS